MKKASLSTGPLWDTPIIKDIIISLTVTVVAHAISQVCFAISSANGWTVTSNWQSAYGFKPSHCKK